MKHLNRAFQPCVHAGGRAARSVGKTLLLRFEPHPAGVWRISNAAAKLDPELDDSRLADDA